jgi:DNA processing protein
MSVSPGSASSLRAHLQLINVPGVGPRTRHRLLKHFGGPEAVLAASEADLSSVDAIRPALAKAIRETSPREADRILAACRNHGVDLLLDSDPRFPPLLRRIDDPPGLLFVRGDLQPTDAFAVAVVGARHATPYGHKVAEQLAGALARAGYTVVSGLARGIDAAAHRGALAASGRTLAVLGSGVLQIYPPEHGSLASEILSAGAVISEVAPWAKPIPGAFPQRNRIIAGLSLGVVVVQAAVRSGAMITARLAGEQGREVFAVPGDIGCSMSHGCHRLIQDGAKLVGSIDDILEELGPLMETVIGSTRGSRTPQNSSSPEPAFQPAERLLDESERSVFAAIPTTAEACLVDHVIDRCGLEAAQVLATLSVLETRRLIRRLPGSRVERV